MKKILMLALLLFPFLVTEAKSYRIDEIPYVQQADRNRYTVNPDGILSAEAVVHIDSVCGALRNEGLAQLAVVAVEDVEGGDPFSFAMELFRKWGVGSSKNSNGLGILLVKNQHEIRFVTGDGLEGTLPDAICKRIQLKYMLPSFREEDYSRGMMAGIDAVNNVLRGDPSLVAELDKPEDDMPMYVGFLIVLGFLVVPLAFVSLLSRWRRRCPKCHACALHQTEQHEVEKSKSYRVVEYTYVCKKCGEVVKRRVKEARNDNLTGGNGGGTIIGGFGGGGYGGGGGYSGGGGYGGGSFGGGGAGSKW